MPEAGNARPILQELCSHYRVTSSAVAAILPLEYLSNYASVPISVCRLLSPRKVILTDSSTPVEASSALQYWTAIVAGDAMTAAVIGESLTNVPLVTTPRFEFTDSPPLGASSSTGAATTISAAVGGESVVFSPLPVQADTPPGTLSVWNVGEDAWGRTGSNINPSFRD